MKYGFVASFGTVEQIIEMARAAEAHGWDGVFTWDGMAVGSVDASGEFAWDGDAVGSIDAYDPWALLGAMATVTERVTLGAMVFALARRRPWKVARESVTVDHLSNGRLVLPVALGAADDGGFSRVNTDTPDRKTRAELLDETLEILDLAWRGEAFSYEGTHYQVREMMFRPKPVQQPRIPTWVVGSWGSEKSMRRALGREGVLPTVRGADPAQPIPVETIREIRDWVAANREADGPFEIVLEGRTSGTDQDANRAQLEPLADAGATWWIESRWEPTDTPGSLLERIRQGPPPP